MQQIKFCHSSECDSVKSAQREKRQKQNKNCDCVTMARTE